MTVRTIDLEPYMLDDEEKLEVKYGLPREVKFCKRCVTSNQKPITTVEVENNEEQLKPTTFFNEDGVCDACLWAEMKSNEIDWEAREKELHRLLDRFRSKNGDYDVIVPGSGGKDSGYAAHILKNKYGMHPLTVTWAPNIYTRVGWKNLHSLIDAGFDNILITPNGAVHRFLTKLAFINLGHPFQPFNFGQRHVGAKTALQNNVKLVFYGENVAEYGNRKEDNLRPQMDKAGYTSVNIDNDDLYLSGVTIRDLREKYGINRSDLLAYAAPDPRAVMESDLEFHYLSYYLKWDLKEHYEYALKHTGYSPAPHRIAGTYQDYCGVDDVMETLHYYMAFIKFGVGRATLDASIDIRSGYMTREEGVEMVRKYDAEPPTRVVKPLLAYLDMDEREFWETVDSFRSPHLWKYDDGEWILRHHV